jgi:hypothetical protein
MILDTIYSVNHPHTDIGIPCDQPITGDSLNPGQDKVDVAATTSDIGMINFEINDTVAKISNTFEGGNTHGPKY